MVISLTPSPSPRGEGSDMPCCDGAFGVCCLFLVGGGLHAFLGGCAPYGCVNKEVMMFLEQYKR